MNKELIKYIENEILPLYNRNEEAHGITHIKNVIKRSIELSKDYDVDINMVYVAAAYHDIGHYIDRKTHEIISAEIFMKDENMKKYFTEEQRMIIKQAIEDHRASNNCEPRNIYGKIISTADRALIDIDNVLERTYLYSIKNYPNLTKEGQIEEVYKYLLEKFGENGYAKIYLKDEEFENALKKLREVLINKKEFIERIDKIIYKIENKKEK